MAIGTPVHVTQIAAATTSVTTGSFTPAASSIIFAWASARHTSSTPADLTVSDSLGLTWTKVGAVTGPLTNAFMKGTLFWATSTNASMTVTVQTATASSSVAVEIVTVPMGTPDTSNSASVGDANGDPSATLSGTPAAAVAFATAQTGNQFTQSNAYTEIVDANPAGLTNQLHNCVAYDLTSPSATCAMTSTNVNTVMFLLELKEATGGKSGTGALSGSGSLSSTGAKASGGTGAQSAAASLPSTGSKRGQGTGAVSEASALTSAGQRTGSGFGSVSAGSTQAASGAKRGAGSGQVSSAASMSSAGSAGQTETHSGQGSTSAAASLSSVGRKSATGTGATTAASLVSNAGTKTGSGSAAIAVVATFEATGSKQPPFGSSRRVSITVVSQAEIDASGAVQKSIRTTAVLRSIVT